MDLLGGYNSDENSTSSSSSKETPTNATSAEIKHPTVLAVQRPTSNVTKRGKKLLSLNSVLPDEIVERLARHEEEDYSTSSEDEEEDGKRVGRKRKRDGNGTSAPMMNGGDGGVKSLIDELKVTKFTKKKNPKPKEVSKSGDSDKFEGLTNVTTEVLKKGEMEEVVDVHVHTPVVQKDIPKQHVRMTNEIRKEKSSTSIPRRNVNIPSVPRPSQVKFTPTITTAPSTHIPPIPQQQQQQEPEQQQPQKKSMSAKQISKALREGNLSVLPSMTTIHQPQTNFQSSYTTATTTIPSKKPLQVELYDDSAGAMIQTNEITTLHKGKHQIHQLAQSARLFEANRLANPGKGNQSRVDAKKKYGW